MADEPPPGWRRPRWYEEQGGFVREQSFGGSPITLAQREPLGGLLLPVLRNIFSCALCSMVCDLDHFFRQFSKRNQLTDAGPEKATAAGERILAPKVPQREAHHLLELALDGTDDDLDLKQLIRATEQMMYALQVLGPWTFIAVRELKSNMSMLEASTSFKGAGAAPKLLDVLSVEGSNGLHQNVGPNCVLSEPSSAMALLWLHRFLALWFEMWREPRPETLKDAIISAYNKSIEPFHSWLIQRTFLLAVAVVPTWGEAREALAAFDEDGEAGMLRNIAALAPLLSRIEIALQREGLWDVRKI